MYLYQNQNRHVIDRRCNFVRVVQMVLCIGCTALSVYNFKYARFVDVSTSTLLTVAGSVFTFLTAVDNVTRAVFQLAIHFKLWLAYAYSGSATFVGCVIVYVCMLDVLNNFWIPIMLTCYSLTGIVFLWDASCIIFFRKYKVVPLSKPNSATSTLAQSKDTYVLRDYQKYGCTTADGETGSEFKISLNDLGSKPRSSRSSPRSANGTPMSYGGTFHMSRDVAPMTSVKNDDFRADNRKHECVNTYS
ncbi:PREDICTED: uncharacterized protein LOC108556659 isoform X2 [Nicrophorus vespilloides]|uniref:Uncharacterized protein LOC108556659 isoform X2 n=1 Tax=Nicrophorus vespilloides TaxID=110193 RepID=A0ABM1M1A1_NICVS|nr:PREDICTED: uncharacterized protein LOC108556659 isoform X2 [Nicrophorus vespilloides]